jgi:hypothetical protein
VDKKEIFRLHNTRCLFTDYFRLGIDIANSVAKNTQTTLMIFANIVADYVLKNVVETQMSVLNIVS